MQPYMMNPNNYMGNISPYQQNQIMHFLANMFPQYQQWGGNQGAIGPGNNAPNNFSPSNNTPIEFMGAFVDNFEQVKNYSVPIGGTVLLMDKNNNKLYTKQLNSQGEPIYNVFKLECIEGSYSAQPIQSQATQGENTDQQSQSSQSRGEQMVADLINTLNQIKNNQDRLENLVNKKFSSYDSRLKQIDGLDDTVT